MVEVEGLIKRYGSVVAVSGLSFRVGVGEIYCLVGPNGAGKTTTLKCIVGLLRPDAGVVRVCGRDVVRDRVGALRNIGYVPENPVVPQHLTVEELARFVASLRGLSWGEVRDEFERLIRMFRLDAKRDALLKELSRGMLQKALVTVALMVEPRVLVMDEPMAGMDPEAQHVFKEEIRRRVAGGAAAIVSSHLLDMVERFCTRVGLIKDGRMVAEGSVDEVKRLAAAGSLEEAFIKMVTGRGG